MGKVLTAFKGAIVGATMLVPGVSGASMAMILGIYGELVSSVSNFFKHKRKSLLFLGLFCAGAVLGMVLIAKPLLALIHLFPKPTMYFFAGAVGGSVPLIFRKTGERTINRKSMGYPLIGAVLVFMLSLIPARSEESAVEGAFLAVLFLVLAGFIAAVALVLPGISVSYFLLLLGMYDKAMRAIGELYLPFLLPLGVGLLLGIILTTKLLEKAMVKHPKPTYLIILGFVLGSVLLVLPGIPSGGSEWLLCLCTAVGGFLIIWKLAALEE